jgi:hypothetical protein
LRGYSNFVPKIKRRGYEIDGGEGQQTFISDPISTKIIIYDLRYGDLGCKKID